MMTTFQNASQVLNRLGAGHAHHLTGRSFLPQLVSGPFGTGLHYAFDFTIAVSLVAAVASARRGGRYVHGQNDALDRELDDGAEGLGQLGSLDDLPPALALQAPPRR